MSTISLIHIALRDKERTYYIEITQPSLGILINKFRKEAMSIIDLNCYMGLSTLNKFKKRNTTNELQ
jgi:hypothetical protein